MSMTLRRDIRWRAAAGPTLLLAAVVCWYWPAVAGWQPAGGDATAFFYPLLVFYGEALGQGYWPPLWNDRWGYGFPGLAESHMGVFYPPHLLVFGLFPPPLAYTLNLLVHMLLAAWFAYFAARTFGVGRAGAGLTGFVFFSGGFFTAQVPHQWAYNTGCWLPLAVLLAWRSLGRHAAETAGRQKDGERVRPDAATATSRVRGHHLHSGWVGVVPSFLLAAVLAVQLLAGHFQLAFYTQVSVLLLAAGSLFLRGMPLRARCGGAARVALAWLGGLILAAVQLLPSWELARYALPEGHSHDYLSGFANTPWHLINYFGGLLLHRNPLWRGVGWSPAAPESPDNPDPWRTSPEECLNYVGLLPLCLAAGGLWRGRREGRVRLWGGILLLSLLFSFGPYAPGFDWLIRLPGFSWFRSAARWNLVTTFGWALLAGIALDRIGSADLRRWIRAFAVVWVAAVGTFVGGVCWLLAREPGDQGAVTRVVRAVWSWTSPWGSPGGFDAMLHNARTPIGLGPSQRQREPAGSGQADERVLAELAGAGYQLAHLANKEVTLRDQLPAILPQELLWHGCVLAALVVLSLWRGLSDRRLRTLAVALTVADLALLLLVRPLRWERLGYVERSPVLNVLREQGRGARSADPLRNLPLATGAAPVLSYRTLDVPVFGPLLGELANIGHRPISREAERLFWLSGIRVSITRGPLPPNPASSLKEVGTNRSAPSVSTMDDPLLVRLDLGRGYAAQAAQLFPGQLKYHVTLWRDLAGEAWAIPLPPGGTASAPSAPEPTRKGTQHPSIAPSALQQLPPLALVLPAKLQRIDPSTVVIEATVSGRSVLVLADLYFPGWEAVIESEGDRWSTEILRAFGAWRAVELPRAGHFRVSMRYRSRPFEWGRWIAGIGWGLWLLGILIAARHSWRGYGRGKQWTAS